MQKMPAIFIGHGSPMNALEKNIYTESWKDFRKYIPEKPRAILIFSAHWITPGETRISMGGHPSMIYDIYGFPAELYRVNYPAPGSLEIAGEISDILLQAGIGVISDTVRGYDHGVWSTLIHLFPEADIPVVQISLDYTANTRALYALGEALSILRDQGILIVGSGNIVHNLGAIDWSGDQVYSWAVEFDTRIGQDLLIQDYDDIMEFHHWGEISRLAHPTYDHLLPLFPLMGAAGKGADIVFTTPEISLGSLSMRSVIWK